MVSAFHFKSSADRTFLSSNSADNMHIHISHTIGDESIALPVIEDQISFRMKCNYMVVWPPLPLSWSKKTSLADVVLESPLLAASILKNIDQQKIPFVVIKHGKQAPLRVASEATAMALMELRAHTVDPPCLSLGLHRCDCTTLDSEV